MKRILILCAVISALTLNTFAYSAFFTLSGESVTEDPFFKVRISARISKTDLPDDETDVIPPDITDVTDLITDVPGVEETLTDEITDGEIPSSDTENTVFFTETSEDTYTDTDSGTALNSGFFGGEGTIIFDKAKLKIVSVSPCAAEGITVEHGNAGGFYRFMFYSDKEMQDDIPLMDIEFQMLTGEGTASVIIAEGLFSDGSFDTPSENVSFTAVYETGGVNPPSTQRPQDSLDLPVTSVIFESSENTEENDTDTQENDDTQTDDRSAVSSEIPGGTDKKSALPVIIAVTAVVVVAVGTAVILIFKKTKK